MQMKRQPKSWAPVLGVLVACLATQSRVQSAPARSWPTYQKGDRGPTVKAIQYLLRARGYKAAIDGVFGAQTQSRVQSLQRARHLVANGRVNGPTWEALVVRVKQGDKGSAVSAVQVLLRASGFDVPLNGVFGPQTLRAVKKWQVRSDEIVDGVVGPFTWNALVAIEELD